jgi:hypothetical protein
MNWIFKQSEPQLLLRASIHRGDFELFFLKQN